MRAFIILAAVLSIGAAHAAESCTSMCHFFDAWADAQVCKNDVTLNDLGAKIAKDFQSDPKLKGLFRNALREAKRHRVSRCSYDRQHPCSDRDQASLEGTPCQYLKPVTIDCDKELCGD